MKNGTKDLHFSCPVSLLYLIQENVTVKASWCDKFCNEPTHPLYLIDLSRNWIQLQSMSLCLKPWLFPQFHSVLEACLTAFLKHAALSQVSCPISYLALIQNQIYLICIQGGKGREALEQMTEGCASISCAEANRVCVSTLTQRNRKVRYWGPTLLCGTQPKY